MGAAAGDPRALLPLGKLESLALPGSSYKLAFTPGLISQVYQRGQTALLPNPANVLGSAADGGGYVDLDGDGHWWIPSGRVFYLPSACPAPQELDRGPASISSCPAASRTRSATVLVRTTTTCSAELLDSLTTSGSPLSQHSDRPSRTITACSSRCSSPTPTATTRRSASMSWGWWPARR